MWRKITYPSNILSEISVHNKEDGTGQDTYHMGNMINTYKLLVGRDRLEYIAI
jgi:hypothetical protein